MAHRGRSPVLIQAGEAARILGWSVDWFHRTWRKVPALVEAAYEGNRPGSPRQWVKRRVQAFKAAKKLLGASPVRAEYEGDDETLRLADALATVFEVLEDSPMLCRAHRAEARRRVAEAKSSPAKGAA